MFFDPFGNLGKMLILLSDIVFLAEIDEVDNWFSGKEEERIYDLDLGNHSNQPCSSERRAIREWRSMFLMSELDFISVRSLRYN